MATGSQARPNVTSLTGRWRVKRVSGLLPPLGVGKRIGERQGVTTVLGLPVARFSIEGREFRYRRLPVCDLLAARGDGTWDGEGRLFGRRFCRFRLIRS